MFGGEVGFVWRGLVLGWRWGLFGFDWDGEFRLGGGWFGFDW